MILQVQPAIRKGCETASLIRDEPVSKGTFSIRLKTGSTKPGQICREEYSSRFACIFLPAEFRLAKCGNIFLISCMVIFRREQQRKQQDDQMK